MDEAGTDVCLAEAMDKRRRRVREHFGEKRHSRLVDLPELKPLHPLSAVSSQDMTSSEETVNFGLDK